jgi:DNA adenine methylase
MGCKSWRNFHRSREALYFIDPPYTAGGKRAGRRLYTHHAIDHDQLFTLCESLQGDFLMTYDEADEVKELARRHHLAMRLIPMKNTHHATMKELVIGRDLAWLDELPVVHEAVAEYRVEAEKP